MKRLSMKADARMAWIYDSSHRDHNSDVAKDLRERRRRALSQAPEYMAREAEFNDTNRASALRSPEPSGGAHD